MKSLLVINDKAIRRKAFRDAELIIRKIDRLESGFDDFHRIDQKLFSDWYALTFRDHENRIRTLEGEYRELAKFHNEMVTIARMHDVSMPEAYRILKDEEAAYASGDETVRAKIDEAQRERDDYLREEMEAERREEEEEYEAEKRSASRHHRSEAEESAIAEIHTFTDDDLAGICSTKFNVRHLLNDLLSLARTPDDARLILRVWSHVPAKLRKAYAKEYQSGWGRSFYDLIERLDEKFGENVGETKEASTAESTDAETEPEPEYIGTKKKPLPKGEAEEAIKILYRQLVRRLHPDLNSEIQEGPSALAAWHKKIWNRMQQSYEKRDHDDLEKIFHLVLIRSRDLTLLTIGEIIESRKWLEAEFAELTSDAKAMKKMPAWGFSRLKSMDKLERKLAKPINDEIRSLENEVNSMKNDQKHLDFLSRMESKPGRRRSKKRRR